MRDADDTPTDFSVTATEFALHKPRLVYWFNDNLNRIEFKKQKTKKKKTNSFFGLLFNIKTLEVRCIETL